MANGNCSLRCVSVYAGEKTTKNFHAYIQYVFEAKMSLTEETTVEGMFQLPQTDQKDETQREKYVLSPRYCLELEDIALLAQKSSA